MGLIVASLLAVAASSPTPSPTAPIATLVTRSASQQQPVRGQGLSEVAKGIKLKLPSDQGRVLTNESVRRLSQGVELTTAKPAGSPLAPAPSAGSPDARKLHWQQQYLAAVTRVSRLEANVTRLEAEANRLQTEFYAHDDPAQRDGVIKPAWDKALADLKRTQTELEQARNAVNDVVSAARQDGAEPGWFRGLEATSEPSLAVAQETASAQPPPLTNPTPRPTPTVVRKKPGGLHN
jgi:hypothetical protein